MPDHQLKPVGSTLKRTFGLAIIIPVLISCSGGGGSGGGGNNNTGGGGGNNSDWRPGVFQSASLFEGRCESPQPGNGDIQGSFLDENNFLRSYSNDTYLWYDEIIDRDPSIFSTEEYFDLLKTNALTPSGNFKDNFHFTIPTDEWIAQSQSGVSAGYGMEVALVSSSPPRKALVAFTEPGTPATSPGADLARGAEILTIDGVNVAFGSNVDALNDGLFPSSAGEIHSFTVRDRDGTERSFSMTSAIITSTPVQNVKTIDTASGKVGYFLFNDHIATAEGGLFDAVTFLAGEGIDELVLDLRYNGGGFLSIASELAYMIAGSAQTSGQTFELTLFNDKHPTTNPITGAPITPTPFHTQSRGFDPVLPVDTPLPTLDLSRVYVLTGSDTCSASESIINGLRGVDVEVIQIGSTTCGKPYGFFPTNNCEITYFTIQFQGVNAKGFGEYPDGFSPENVSAVEGVEIPGCSVADDFSRDLGDPLEVRLKAALDHIETGTCPTPSGFFQPVLSLSGPLPSDNMMINKSLWQRNRIMEP